MNMSREPRWLDSAQQHSWRALVVGTTLLMDRLDDDLRRALSAGLVLGAVDATAVILAARRGAMSKGSALGALLVLGGIAALGVAASRD